MKRVNKNIKELGGAVEGELRKEQSPTKKDPNSLVIRSMVQVIKQNEINTKDLISVVAQLAKEKPKKHFRCSVSRDTENTIKTVDIKEV